MRANSGAFVEIKTIVASSALLFTAFSGAHAADAIVAAEPEPMEYVRVCDAYGDGYFYIPGTETCLSIGGYIRSEGRFGRNRAGTSDWSFWNRAQMTLSTKNDTEYGTLAGVITLRGNIENSNSATTFLQEAYIDIANLRVGMQYSWWDNDRSMSGETDVVSSNQTVHNSIRYMFADTKTFSLGIAVDELEETYRTKPGEGPNNVGIAGQVFVDGGVLSGYLLGSYDTDTEEGAVRAIAYADFDSEPDRHIRPLGKRRELLFRRGRMEPWRAVPDQGHGQVFDHSGRAIPEQYRPRCQWRFHGWRYLAGRRDARL